MLHEIPRTVAAPDIPQITAEEAAASARAVMTLFERWQVSDSDAREILGGMAPRTYARWKAGELGRIDRDLATRLSGRPCCLWLGIAVNHHPIRLHNVPGKGC